MGKPSKRVVTCTFLALDCYCMMLRTSLVPFTKSFSWMFFVNLPAFSWGRARMSSTLKRIRFVDD